MIGRLVNLPVRLARKVRDLLGNKKETAAPARPAPPPAPARPRPPVNMHEDEDEGGGGGHDHSHGHSHGHSHDHGHGRAPEPEPTAPKLNVSVEQTPNPNAVKFTLDRKVFGATSFTFNSAAEAQSHAVGRALLGIKGVKSVFGVNNFVTVTRDEEVPWDRLTSEITRALQTSI